MKHHSTTVLGTDGTPQFHRPEDGKREDTLAHIIRNDFRCDELVNLGHLTHIDYLAIRNGRAVAGIELITRKQTHKQLLAWGGVFIKGATLAIAQSWADVPMSTKWAGVFFFYDLADGLYYQEARHITGTPAVIRDPRQANTNDTESGLNIQNLILWKPWERTNQ